MKRKLASVLGISILAVSLAACGGGTEKKDAGEKPVKQEQSAEKKASEKSKPKEEKDEEIKEGEALGLFGFNDVQTALEKLSDTADITVDMLEMSVSSETGETMLTVKNNSKEEIEGITMYRSNDGNSSIVVIDDPIPAGGSVTEKINGNAASVEELNLMSIEMMVKEKSITYFNNIGKYVVEDMNPDKLLKLKKEKTEEKKVKSFDEVKDKFPTLIEEGADDKYKYSAVFVNTYKTPVLEASYSGKDTYFSSSYAILPEEKSFYRSSMERTIGNMKSVTVSVLDKDGTITEYDYYDNDKDRTYTETKILSPVVESAVPIVESIKDKVKDIKVEAMPGGNFGPDLVVHNGLDKDLIDFKVVLRDTVTNQVSDVALYGEAIKAGEDSLKNTAIMLESPENFEPRRYEFKIADEKGDLYRVSYDLKVAEFFAE